MVIQGEGRAKRTEGEGWGKVLRTGGVGPGRDGDPGRRGRGGVAANSTYQGEQHIRLQLLQHLCNLQAEQLSVILTLNNGPHRND